MKWRTMEASLLFVALQPLFDSKMQARFQLSGVTAVTIHENKGALFKNSRAGINLELLLAD